MSIKEQIDADLKTAMLAGDKALVTTLRGLKSTILYAEVADGSRETGGLDDPTVIALLQKEAKKRQESADLYGAGGNEQKRIAELDEKSVIEKYLPEQLSENEVAEVVNKTITKLGATSVKEMGQVISAVKNELGPSADGALIARLVKEQLQP